MQLLVLLLLTSFLASSSSRYVVKRQAIKDQRIVCYFTYWSTTERKFTPQDIDPFVCTHIHYAFSAIDTDKTALKFNWNKDNEESLIRGLNDLKALNPDLKVLPSVGGWLVGSPKFSEIASTEESRKKLVDNALTFLRQHELDGLDVDWQYPGSRGTKNPNDKANHALLLKKFRETFEEESQRTGQPRLLLSTSVARDLDQIERSYDIPTLNNYVDYYNLVAYDYVRDTDPVVRHHAPLYTLPEDIDDPIISQLNVDNSVRNLLRKGIPPQMINIGIPGYGRYFKLEDPTMTAPGSPAAGGSAGKTTNETGFIAYNELCLEIDSWVVKHPNRTAVGPYAFKEGRWVGYDDGGSAKLKGEYAKKMNLGGLMYWTVDFDDYRGDCNGVSFPLIRAGREGFLNKEVMRQGSSFQTTATSPPRMTVPTQTSAMTPPSLTPTVTPSSQPTTMTPQPSSPVITPTPKPAEPSRVIKVPSLPISSLPEISINADNLPKHPSGYSDKGFIAILFPKNVYIQDKVWVINLNGSGL